MLDRIGNISLDTNLKKSKANKLAVEKYKKSIVASSGNINDKISFSSASKYLSRAKWNLREIDQSSKERVSIDFNFSGFEFQSTIDLTSLKTVNHINYKVSKIVNDSKSIMAIFKVNIADLDQSENHYESFKYLGYLFKRFEGLDIKSELNSFNYEMMDALMDDLKSGLCKEFDYINYTFLLFAEKLTGNRIIAQIKPNVQKQSNVVIQRIKPL